jgi:hypothetical protein
MSKRLKFLKLKEDFPGIEPEILMSIYAIQGYNLEATVTELAEFNILSPNLRRAREEQLRKEMAEEKSRKEEEEREKAIRQKLRKPLAKGTRSPEAAEVIFTRDYSNPRCP